MIHTLSEFLNSSKVVPNGLLWTVTVSAADSTYTFNRCKGETPVEAKQAAWEYYQKLLKLKEKSHHKRRLHK